MAAGICRLESERAVMDEAHVRAGWFLRYPNGTVFDKKQHVRNNLFLDQHHHVVANSEVRESLI